MRHKTIVIVAVAVVLGSLAGLAWYLKAHAGPIPSSIKHKLGFAVLYPQQNVPNLAVQRASLSYDEASGGLSYAVRLSGKKVVITEQPTPSIFNEAGTYSFKLNQAHNYAHFTTTNGDVDLTKPDGLQNQTVAWANTKGVLVLAHAFQNLDNTEWKTLFDNLRPL